MTGLDYDRILGRITRLMAGLALLGALCWFLAAGWPGLLSFLGGSAISALSFWLLHRLVSDLSAAAEGRPVRPASVILHAARMLILGGAAYAILHTYGSFPPALVTGLVLAISAATVEVLLELFYARA